MYLIKNKYIVFIFLILSMINYGNDFFNLDAETITKKEITEYWEKLEEKADKFYKGLDLSVEIATGIYKIDDTEDEEYNGEIKVKVPLYSKKDQREKKEKKRAYLDRGAELIKNLEIRVGKRVILMEKEAILSTIMMEEGVSSIEAYHQVREDRMSVEAEINETLRKLNSMLM